ncbi:FtsX-like permease family protein, partial [Brucella sp. 21LCYQ03]|nr:FtsX-like permease family protein [Brucella sp. 21LCYQ03]
PTQFELQSIRDSYLKSDFGAYQIIRGSQQNLYIYAGIAVLVLLMACINYVNLSTAQASSRLKITGIRKVLGASKHSLIAQFLLESLLMFAAALAISIVFYLIALPYVEHFIGNKIASAYRLTHFVGMVLIVIVISLLSGLYPAWFITRLAANGVLKKSLKTNKSSKSYLRSTLVITQFSLSIIILVAMLVVQSQVYFMKNKETGIDTEGLISIGGISFDNQLEAFKNKLYEHPNIMHLSLSSWLPTDGPGYMTRLVEDPKNPQNKFELWYIAGEPNLAETLGLKLREGR